jgi:sugar transferase (PEP-CTERM system associated)
MVTLRSSIVPAPVIVQVVLESAIFALSIVAAVALYSAGQPALSSNMVLPALFFASLMVLVSVLLGVYRFERPLSQRELVLRKLAALFAGVPTAYLAFFLMPDSDVYQHAIGLTAFLALGGGLVLHVGRYSTSRSGLFANRILIVGTGREAMGVKNVLSGLPIDEVTVVGVYPLGTERGQVTAGYRLVQEGLSLDAAALALGVNEIVVAVREQRGGVLPLRQLVDCRLRGIRVTCLPSFYERVCGEIPIDSLKAGWLMYSDGFRQGMARRMVKRSFDFIAALALLTVSLPIMVVTAIAIAMESSGPILLRQERVGAGGRTFRLLKFRSMRNDAEKDGVPQWATSHDSRITRVGRLIRRSRIDELPQIFNVLKGEMSFVGPRPERPFFVSQLIEEIPFYGARHSIKPGITGWAQVRYSYGASKEDAMRKLQFDLYYVKNHTLFLDLLILIGTVRVVLLGQGAR